MNNFDHLVALYADIISHNDYVLGEKGSTENDKSPMASSREALAQLSKLIHVTSESQMTNYYGVSIVDELKMLMSRLNMRVKFPFINFLYLICPL